MTSTELTTIQNISKNLAALRTDYEGCIKAFNEADSITGTAFHEMIISMGDAARFYLEEKDTLHGFVKRFSEDSGKSLDYVKKLNRIRNDEIVPRGAPFLSLHGAMALLAAPEELKEEIVGKLTAGEEISTAAIKEQVKEARANLVPEAEAELKDQLRKEENVAKEKAKKEREQKARDRNPPARANSDLRVTFIVST